MFRKPKEWWQVVRIAFKNPSKEYEELFKISDDLHKTSQCLENPDLRYENVEKLFAISRRNEKVREITPGVSQEKRLIFEDINDCFNRLYSPKLGIEEEFRILKSIEKNAKQFQRVHSLLCLNNFKDGYEKYFAEIEILRGKCFSIRTYKDKDLKNYKKKVLQKLNFIEEELETKVKEYLNASKVAIKWKESIKEKGSEEIEVKMAKQHIKDIHSKFPDIQNILDSFKGTQIEDSYYILDKTITNLMISVDAIPNLNNEEIKKNRKELFTVLEKFSEEFEEKCKNAPSVVTPEEREKKIVNCSRLKKDLENVKKDVENYKNENYEIIDENLFQLFLNAKNIETMYDEEVEMVRKETIREIQNVMLELAQKKIDETIIN